jgi:hypothetical protein
MTAGRFEIVLPELDNFEKAEKLAFLWAPETGRATGQAAIVGILANPAFACVLPTVLSAEEVRDHRRRSARFEDLRSRNFGHADRYVMSLKSSV